MQRLLLLGMNHTTAQLDLREKLAFGGADRDAALAELHGRFAQCEFVLLSTCNRTELYLARQPHASPRFDELIEYLAQKRQLPPQELSGHMYQKTDREVAAHLFAVASSLDSMVLGETQILGQVRQAYDAACQAGTVAAMLNPLFQRALAVGKQVLTQTALAEGRVSVASVAVDYARRIFDTFADKTVLSIGAGKMAALVLTNLAALSPRRLVICNRDPAKAAALGQAFGAEVVPLDNLGDHLAGADIGVCSTGSPAPIITRALMESVMRRRRYKPVFLIDIALPRDVAPDVARMENVYLYNLDDLQQAVAATRSQRSAALAAAAIIVADHVEQFVAAQRTRQLGPIIDELYRRSHELAQEELSRTLAKMPQICDADRRQLEDLARRIVNKMLHDPIQMLRSTDGPHGSVIQYLHTMEKLFKLEPPEKGGQDPFQEKGGQDPFPTEDPPAS